ADRRIARRPTPRKTPTATTKTAFRSAVARRCRVIGCMTAHRTVVRYNGTLRRRPPRCGARCRGIDCRCRTAHPPAAKGVHNMRVTVMGASGLIGSKVVDLLTAEGHEVVAASRSSGVDAITGDGIGDALAEANVLVDVTNSPSFE